MLSRIVQQSKATAFWVQKAVGSIKVGTAEPLPKTEKVIWIRPFSIPNGNLFSKSQFRLCWLLIHPPGFVRWKGVIMLFSLVNLREQHDEEIPFLASRAYQKLDKTCHASLNHRFTFRPNTQSYRSNCIKCVVTLATDHSKASSQATSVAQPWSNSSRSSFPL